MIQGLVQTLLVRLPLAYIMRFKPDAALQRRRRERRIPMTEPMESGKYTPGAQTAGIVKWLRYLLIIQVIGLAVTVLGAVCSLALWAWLGRGVSVATAVVLFALAAWQPR